MAQRRGPGHTSGNEGQTDLAPVGGEHVEVHGALRASEERASDVASGVESSVHADDAPAAGSLDQPRRVLVVDDNANHAEVIAELIGDLGHEAHVAHDGPTALARAAEIRPHLVLLDIGLPAVNGYDVARSLRQGAPDDVPMLVALTGYGQPEDRERSAEAGFDEHIVKPIGLDDLKRILSAAQRQANGDQQS